jgi:hypothetical protein
VPRSVARAHSMSFGTKAGRQSTCSRARCGRLQTDRDFPQAGRVARGGACDGADKMPTFDGKRKVIEVGPCDVVTMDAEGVGPQRSTDVTASPPGGLEDTSLRRPPQSHRNNSGQTRTEEVELSSMSTATESVDIQLDGAQPLCRASRTRLRSVDAQDERRLFGSYGSREHPPSCRHSVRLSHSKCSQIRSSASPMTIHVRV